MMLVMWIKNLGPLQIWLMSLGSNVVVFFFVVLLDIVLSPGGRCVMVAAAAFEIKVEYISRMGRVVVCWESTSMFACR